MSTSDAGRYVSWWRYLLCALRGHPGVRPEIRSAGKHFNIIAPCRNCGRRVNL